MPTRFDVLKMAGGAAALTALPLGAGAFGFENTFTRIRFSGAEMARLLSAIGVIQAQEPGMIWRADGYHIKTPMNQGLVLPSNAVRGKILVGPGECQDPNNCPTGPGPSNPPIAYSTGGYSLQGDVVGFMNQGTANTIYPVNTYYQSYTGQGNYSFPPDVQGPGYWMARAVHNCSSDLASGIQQAYSVAKFVVANGPKFAVAVGASAALAVKLYQGGQFPIAAAGRFLAGLVGTLTVAEAAYVLAGVGLTVLILYGLWHCLTVGA